MTDDFDARRDAHEQEIARGVRMLFANPDAAPLIRARLPFINKTGSFKGEAVFGLADTNYTYGNEYVGYTARSQSGHFDIVNMDPDARTMFLKDLEDIASYRGNVYVVTSYRTVIAWTRPVTHDGRLIVPPVEYTQTTTKHQRITGESRN